MSDQVVKEWLKYPTGKIDKGTWCQHCARFNTRNMTSSMILLHKGQVLLIKRKKDPEAGSWALPGGYLDWNETIEECAIRECEEELGLRVKSAKLNGVFSDPTRDPDGRQNVECGFWTEITEEEIRRIQPHKDEVDGIQWFDLNNLPEKIAFDHKQGIELLKKSLS